MVWTSEIPVFSAARSVSRATTLLEASLCRTSLLFFIGNGGRDPDG
jgi:hypothetical protein